jgi:6-pyruvoyltetrahydropterin/6-carboxytetrahydropterin synthase
MILSRSFEFTMGHRVLGHEKEMQIHGHRFQLQIQVEGSVKDEDGFVVDFSEIENVVQKNVLNRLDHAFVYQVTDSAMADFFEKNSNLKSMTLDKPPTFEFVLEWIFTQVSKPLKDLGVTLKETKLWEGNSCCILSC